MKETCSYGYVQLSFQVNTNYEGRSVQNSKTGRGKRQNDQFVLTRLSNEYLLLYAKSIHSGI